MNRKKSVWSVPRPLNVTHQYHYIATPRKCVYCLFDSYLAFKTDNNRETSSFVKQKIPNSRMTSFLVIIIYITFTD